MECYSCQYQHGGGGNFGSKEKRPPLKRGQLKRQIARTISNLVAPRNAASASAREKAGRGSGFSRAPSYN